MEAKIVKTDKRHDRVTLLIQKIKPASANLLRRMIIHEVPTLAIEDVEFRKNSSIVYDEVIAHRLGLIPLKTDLKSYNLSSICGCKGEGCLKCTVSLTLKVKAKSDMIVTAEELQSKDPKIKPIFPKMPIAKLLKGQTLEFEATAKMGAGKEHIKWSPGLIFYKYQPIVNIIKEPKDANELVSRYPNLFTLNKGKLSIKEGAEYSSEVLTEIQEYSKGAVKVEEKNDAVVFTIEPWGQLKPQEMINEALERFSTKLEGFEQQLASLG